MPIRRAISSRKPDRATLRELVLTWPVRQMRDVSVPPPKDGVGDPEWSWKYEQQYGAPGANDRESVLRTVLNVLSNGGKKDVQQIVAELHRIKGLALDNALHGFQMNRQREEAEEADKIRRNLAEWLLRAISLHERLNPDDLPSALRFRRAYEVMLTAVTFHEPMTHEERPLRDWLLSPRPVAMVRRRKTRGNPDAMLVEKAHHLLTDVQVPREHHRELLWAIGLLDKKGNLHSRRNLARS